MHERGKGAWGARSEPPSADDAAAWITGAVPDDWFTAAPEVVVDRDEILIVGTLAPPKHDTGTVDEAERATAERGRISSFREETRERRIRIAIADADCAKAGRAL